MELPGSGFRFSTIISNLIPGILVSFSFYIILWYYSELNLNQKLLEISEVLLFFLLIIASVTFGMLIDYIHHWFFEEYIYDSNRFIALVNTILPRKRLRDRDLENKRRWDNLNYYHNSSTWLHFFALNSYPFEYYLNVHHPAEEFFANMSIALAFSASTYPTLFIYKALLLPYWLYTLMYIIIVVIAVAFFLAGGIMRIENRELRLDIIEGCLAFGKT